MNEDTLLLPNLLWKVATSRCYVYKTDWDWKMGSTELLKYTPNAYFCYGDVKLMKNMEWDPSQQQSS